MFSQLGFVPEGLPVDALEISPLHSAAEAAERFGQVRDYPLVRSSDAHRLADIGLACTAFTGAAPSVKELRKALRGEDRRAVLA